MGGASSREFVEQLRAAADLARLVSEYVPLKPAGRRLKGLCPFHEEKTPSFSVDPERQLFFCFGCGAGGDVFRFVELYEKVGFREAAEMLARRFGVPIPAAGDGTRSDARARVVEMNRLADAFFRARLAGPEGERARQYVESRGLGASTGERLGLGYAPDSWEALFGHLGSRHFRPDELVRGGLALASKSGRGHYDRFRNRLVFPIRDLTGTVVAFGGRALGDDEPKYLNSPETPAYVKGDHLYGLDQAREAIRREKVAVVVEGYMDAAALLQIGVDNVVASLGTSFTPAQARLLARYTDRVTFSYDGDAAGAAATERSVGLFMARGLLVRVVELPAGHDPDDVIRAEGAEAYVRRLRGAPEFLEFLIKRQVAERDLERLQEQVAAVNAVLPHLARLSSPIERSGWVSRLAEALGIDDRLVLQELRGALRSGAREIRQRAATDTLPGEAESRLVWLLLGSDAAREEAAAQLEPDDLAGTRVGRIVETILDAGAGDGPVDYPSVLDRLANQEDRELLTRLAFHDLPETGPGVADCVWSLRRRRLDRRIQDETKEIARLSRGESSPPASEVDAALARQLESARQRDAMS